MSKANLLAMAAVLLLATGSAMLLLGSSGGGVAPAAIVLGSGALALVGFLVLRRGRPQPTPSGDGRPPAAGPTRTGVIAAIAGGSLGAVALLLSLSVAEGEARSHAFFHLIFGVIVLGLLVAIDRWWRPRDGSAAASIRVPLSVLLWIAAAASFLESIGAAGYDRFNAAHRIEWLTSVHNAVTAFGALTLVMIPVGTAVLMYALVDRRRASKAPAA